MYPCNGGRRYKILSKLNFETIEIVTENKKSSITINKNQGNLCINGKELSEFLKFDDEKNDILPLDIEIRKSDRKSLGSDAFY